MTQPNSYYQTIADNGWFVFFAYFFAFAAWSAVSGNDFISSSWKTVGETRRRGQLHLFVVTVPMLYMTTYIYFQFKIRDFKEMNAAIVALGFAVLHLFRTVWGLWQLHVFKQWLVASIKSIESLGYKSALYGKGASDSSCLTTPVKVAKTSSERYEQINREVDYVRVNDTIVENRLSEGEVKCYLRFLTAKQKREVREAGTAIKKVLKALRFGAQNCFRLLGIIWPLAFSSSPMFSNRDSAPFLDPTEPEELWLRWATVLVSHAIPDWLVDMNKACATERKERGKDFDSNRDRFASEVLISTALHSRSTDKVESQITEKAQGNVVGGEPETFSASHKFLPFGYWKKFPKLCSGRFSKQEFLERACTTGNGLPFNAPHPLAKIGEGDDVVYSYRLFASKLYRAREELPADDGERVKKLGIDELEWLSIFLSVEDWSTSEGSNEHIADGSSEGKKPDPGAKIESNEHSNVELTGSDISVANLSDQLGFGVSSKTFFERFSIPFLTKSAGSTTVWGNRNVLELSVHVDNWLALCSGDQVTYMEEKSNEIVSEIPPASPTRHQADGDNVVSPDQAVASDENLWRKCVEFERKRLMFQFSVLDPEHSYFDQSLTFLGANMENLRSSLARWVEINHDTQHSSWEPSISPEIAPSGDEQAAPKQEFMIKASRDFENCLWSMQSEKDWSQRYVQMRLLWELQSGFQNMLPKDGVCPNQTEAMILCILSFPSICIDVKAIQPDRQTASMPDTVINIEENQETVPRKEEHEEAQYTEETFSIEDFELLLRAAYGPQKFHINVSFSRRTMGAGFCISVRLCNEEPSRTARFVWEAWRDSFAGGLEGMRQWQGERKFSQQLPLLRSTEEIGAGIFEIDTPQAGTGAKMKTWRGWIPHRASVCKYEIMNDGFIPHRKKTGVITTNAKMSNKNYRTKIETPREQTVPVRYDQAERNALKHASVVVHGYLLRVSKNSTYAFTGTDTLSTDLRSRADAMYNDKNWDRDMALLLYEISATETGDLKALQKAVSMLIKEKRNDDNQSIERAVALMERFYISGTNTSKQSGTAYNRFQDNEWVTHCQDSVL